MEIQTRGADLANEPALLGREVSWDFSPVYDAANARAGVAQWTAPANGYFHFVEVSIGLSGTAGGPTLLQLRNTTQGTELFAAGNRPSLASGGANVSVFDTVAAADMQNRDFNAGDVIVLDVDALATNAAGLHVKAIVMLGKRTTEETLPVLA